MIVRERGDLGGTMECIRQHDHAALSAALADAWVLGGVLDEDVRFAVVNHDVAWVGLDQRARLGADRSAHTFLDHPLQAKYDAHRAGVDLVETGSTYAAVLCSGHYARFASMLDDECSRAYLDHEQRRQQRLWPQLNAVQRARVEHDLAVLRLLDALSLFVCCNRPGEVTWPFHRDGFRLGDQRLGASWVDTATVRLDPDPLDAPVHCAYRAYRWDEDGALIDPVRYEVCFSG